MIKKKPLNKVTDKQKKFAEYYLKGNSKKDAAILAGYSPKSAGQNAEAALKNSHVKSLVTRAQNKIVEDARFNFQWKYNKLGRVAEVTIPDDSDDMSLAGLGIQAISNMNKMQGDEAAEKRVNVNIDADSDIEMLAQLIKKNEKDY